MSLAPTISGPVGFLGFLCVCLSGFYSSPWVVLPYIQLGISLNTEILKRVLVEISMICLSVYLSLSLSFLSLVLSQQFSPFCLAVQNLAVQISLTPDSGLHFFPLGVFIGFQLGPPP